MPADCDCDVVRDSETGLKIGGKINPIVCICPNRRIKQIKFEFLLSTGFFVSWPAFVIMDMVRVGDCEMFGEVLNIGGDPGNAILLEYGEGFIPVWRFAIRASGFASTFTDFYGNNGFQNADVDHASSLSTLSYNSCNPAAIPGDVGVLISWNDDSTSIYTTII